MIRLDDYFSSNLTLWDISQDQKVQILTTNGEI